MACNCGSDDDSSGSTVEINTGVDVCAEAAQNPPVPVAASCGVSCSCGCDPCQCQQLGIATPLPYYNQVPECQESHTKNIISQHFVTSIAVGTGFVFPDCNMSVFITLPGVQSLQPGSYLWSSSFGYLKVIGFDYASATATVLNECQENNTAPGTFVPPCTLFNVVDPPFQLATACGDGVWVTADFIAPLFLATVAVDVTGTQGLLVGRKIQIGSYTYQLMSIITPTQILVANYGGGAAPGSTVHAYDANGNCITPVTLYDLDICGQDISPALTGKIVVCDPLTDTLKPLEASAIGQVPVCIDSDDNIFEPQTLDIPETVCTHLTACLTLISGTDTYTLVVADSTDFQIGDLVLIKDPNVVDSGGDPIQWLITNIPGVDDFHIDVESKDPNTLDYSVANGVFVCKVQCCVQLRHDLDEFEADMNDICNQDWSAAQKGQVKLDWDADETFSFAGPDPVSPHTFAARSVTFTNDTCDTMRIFLTVDYLIQCEFATTSEGAWARLSFEPRTGQSTDTIPPGTPAAPVMASLRTLVDEIVFGIGPGPACNPFTSKHYLQFHHSEVIAIAPNTVLRYDADQKFTYVDYQPSSDSCSDFTGVTDGTGILQITVASVHIAALGLAIKEA